MVIVEGLVQWIVNGEVLDGLKDKCVLFLDMGVLIVGVKFCGEFEECLKVVLNELVKQEGQVILFIDEIYIMVGVGKVEGFMDVGNMFKLVLVWGELYCVGVIILDEYWENIEKDVVLECCFQKVLVSEFNEEDIIVIFWGFKECYEVYYGVEVIDGVIIVVVKLLYCYIIDCQLLDKVIDLVDEVVSQICMEMDFKLEVFDCLECCLIQLKIECEVLKKEMDVVLKKWLEELFGVIVGVEWEYVDLEEVWNMEKVVLYGFQKIKSKFEQVCIDLENV